MIVLLTEIAEVDDKTKKIIRKEGKIVIQEWEITQENVPFLSFRLSECLNQVKRKWDKEVK